MLFTDAQNIILFLLFELEIRCVSPGRVLTFHDPLGKVRTLWLFPSYVCIRLCKHGQHDLCRISYKRNIKRAPCLDSLLQTLEGVLENSLVCVNARLRIGFTQTFEFSQTLSRVCSRLCKHGACKLTELLPGNWSIPLKTWLSHPLPCFNVYIG